MKISISFEIKISRGRGKGTKAPPEEDQKKPEANGVAAQKGWRTQVRKLWGRLKGPKPQKKKEAEEKLEQNGAASREQILTLQSQLGNVLSVLLNAGATTSRGEEDGTALEEGEELDAAEIPAPHVLQPSDMGESEVEGQNGGAAGEPAPSAARVDYSVFDLRNLPARFRCCPPGLGPCVRFDHRIATADSVLRPAVSWSSLRTYRTPSAGSAEELDDILGSMRPRRGRLPRRVQQPATNAVFNVGAGVAGPSAGCQPEWAQVEVGVGEEEDPLWDCF
ncbi:hypothetical protein ABW19_dt0202591 [Dactylella cylindrospora]|nr:hypothetical protein ABW19_dt0202591 [Dactylella cylindrospora]